MVVLELLMSALHLHIRDQENEAGARRHSGGVGAPGAPALSIIWDHHTDKRFSADLLLSTLEQNGSIASSGFKFL